MKYHGAGLIYVVLGFLFIFACSNGDTMQESKNYIKVLEDISDQKWKKISGQKIYFGHQSVGFNIIDGITDIMKENKAIDLDIKETSELGHFEKAVFAHSRNGQNRDWQSKIEGFRDKINNGLGNNADIAFFKFCYVDITGQTDVGKLFDSYKKTMDQLQKAYPDTVFLHPTVPLTTTKSSWKTWIKKLIGKDHIWEYADNIKRNEFNDLMRRQYEASGKLLDIAQIESTRPDGTRESFEKDGSTYSSLVPSYTYDGGHLNETGRKMVAARLLRLMAEQSG